MKRSGSMCRALVFQTCINSWGAKIASNTLLILVRNAWFFSMIGLSLSPSFRFRLFGFGFGFFFLPIGCFLG